MVGGGGGIRPRRFLGRLARGGDFRLNLGGDGVQLGLGRQFFRQHDGAQPFDRAALAPGGNLLAGAVGVVAHALGMGPGAIGLAFDQGGAAAAAGPLHRFARHPLDFQHVVAVDFEPGHAVGDRARGHAGIAGDVGERDFGREFVVFAHK